MTGILKLTSDSYLTISPLWTKSSQLRSDLIRNSIERDSIHEFGEVAAEHRITETEEGKTVLTIRSYLDNSQKKAWVEVELDLLDDIEFLLKASKILHKKALKLRDRTQALDALEE